MARKGRRRFSAKQIAAQKRFAAMARARARGHKTSSRRRRSGRRRSHPVIRKEAPVARTRRRSRRSGRRGRSVIRRSGRRHTSRVRRGKRFGRRGGGTNVLAKYFPSGVVPLVGGAAIGFATGAAIKTYLQNKAMMATGKPGFTGSDIGSAAFDVVHAGLAYFLLPRKLGKARAGYAIGATLPTGTFYAAKAVGAIRDQILKMSGGAGGGGGGGAGLPAGASGVRSLTDASGRQNVSVVQQAAQPSAVQQIASAIGSVLQAANGGGGAVAGLEDDDEGEGWGAGEYDGADPNYSLNGFRR